MAELPKSDNLRSLLKGAVLAFVVALIFLLYQGAKLKEALFGVFYFLVTPFLAIPKLPLSIVVMLIIFLLLRRASSCMRKNLRWLAYAILLLHWEAWGLYCAR